MMRYRPVPNKYATDQQKATARNLEHVFNKVIKGNQWTRTINGTIYKFDRGGGRNRCTIYAQGVAPQKIQPKKPVIVEEFYKTIAQGLSIALNNPSSPGIHLVYSKDQEKFIEQSVLFNDDTEIIYSGDSDECAPVASFYGSGGGYISISVARGYDDTINSVSVRNGKYIYENTVFIGHERLFASGALSQISGKRSVIEPFLYKASATSERFKGFLAVSDDSNLYLYTFLIKGNPYKQKLSAPFKPVKDIELVDTIPFSADVAPSSYQSEDNILHNNFVGWTRPQGDSGYIVADTNREIIADPYDSHSRTREVFEFSIIDTDGVFTIDITHQSEYQSYSDYVDSGPNKTGAWPDFVKGEVYTAITKGELPCQVGSTRNYTYDAHGSSSDSTNMVAFDYIIRDGNDDAIPVKKTVSGNSSTNLSHIEHWDTLADSYIDPDTLQEVCTTAWSQYVDLTVDSSSSGSATYYIGSNQFDETKSFSFTEYSEGSNSESHYLPAEDITTTFASNSNGVMLIYTDVKNDVFMYERGESTSYGGGVEIHLILLTGGIETILRSREYYGSYIGPYFRRHSLSWLLDKPTYDDRVHTENGYYTDLGETDQRDGLYGSGPPIGTIYRPDIPLVFDGYNSEFILSMKVSAVNGDHIIILNLPEADTKLGVIPEEDILIFNGSEISASGDAGLGIPAISEIKTTFAT